MGAKSTLRKWLDEEGFDWKSGTIVYQETESYYPGWTHDCGFKPGEIISVIHPILDREFYSGYGGPECPRIFARDQYAIYFPGQYDGATWLEKIAIDIGHYCIPGNKTPYPGG